MSEVALKRGQRYDVFSAATWFRTVYVGEIQDTPEHGHAFIRLDVEGVPERDVFVYVPSGQVDELVRMP